MTLIEIVENMLEEATVPEKDAAGVFIPAAMDAAIRRKTCEDFLVILRRKEANGTL